MSNHYSSFIVQIALVIVMVISQSTFTACSQLFPGCERVVDEWQEDHKDNRIMTKEFVNNNGDSDPENSITVLLLGRTQISRELVHNFEMQFNAKVTIKSPFYDHPYTFENIRDFYANNHVDSIKYRYKDIVYVDRNIFQADVLIMSDYQIEQALKDKKLQPIDKSVMTNLSGLSDAVKKLSFDPDNIYSIPYCWGNVGIVYYRNLVDHKLVEKEGYSIFRNKQFERKICWPKGTDKNWPNGGEEYSFMIALKALGYSMNTQNRDEIDEAYVWLCDMDKEMDPHIVQMSNFPEYIGFASSHDAVFQLKRNIKADYWVPDDGTNIWYESMVIPEQASNPRLANTFINYVISYDAALLNTIAVGCISPIAKVYDEVTKSGGEFENNAAYKPRLGYAKDEIFHENNDIFGLFLRMWRVIRQMNLDRHGDGMGSTEPGVSSSSSDDD